MTEIKWLVRLGKKLQQAWLANSAQTSRDHQYSLNRLQLRQDDVQTAWRLVEKARGGNLTSVRPQLQAQLLRRVQDVCDAAVSLTRQLEEPIAQAPSLSFLVAELQGLQDEFGDLHIDWQEKLLSVTTEPITLQDVELGPFAIQLSWNSLARKWDVLCFEVVALEPNPAAANDLVTHPHVKNRHLCPGDAGAPVHKALQEGRIGDAFILVRSVLCHYNPGSPHVRLEDWHGCQCRDCSSFMSDEERYSCEACGHDYCEDCIGDCAGCSSTRCHACLILCEVCEASFCSGCLQPSAHSSRDCCRNCLGTCARCKAEVARDELSAGTSFCPTCQEAVQAADLRPELSAPKLETPNLENPDATTPGPIACAS